MYVSPPTIEFEGDSCQLAADVRLETPERETMRVWFRFPREFAPPSHPGDPFLAGLMIPAMSLGEDLEIDAPVSTELLDAARSRLRPVLRKWGWDFGEGTGSEICAEARPGVPFEPSRGTASFFSGGVDSWYSVLKRREELTSLIYVLGIDIRVHERERWKAALDLTQASARRLGLPLRVVETNLQEIAFQHMVPRLARLRRPVPYYSVERSSGSMLVAIASLFRSQIERAIIPASWSYAEMQPNGSHWLLEPMLSTPAQRYEIDGGEAERIEKVGFIQATMPEALDRIRVCFAKNSSDLNCGRCEKCVRTMVEMRLSGAGDHFASFAEPLTLESVACVKLRNADYLRPFWRELAEQARACGDLELLAALEAATGKRINWMKLRRRLASKLGISR